mgnify:CR=1 FL=1
MYDTMAQADGVGIAAVQVGILKRIVICAIENDESGEFEAIEMINPEILEASEETQICMEGCLSLPGYQGEVERPKKVKVKWTDRDGEDHTEEFENLGFANTPICIAKTPQSLSDDPKLMGVPHNVPITIREVRLSAGAGFIVPLTGAIMTMPGLPKVPAAVKMENEEI